MADEKPLILWFRHDLRLDDNPALIAAAQSKKPVIPIYIFDNQAEDYGAASKLWLHHSLKVLSEEIKKKYKLDLIIREANSFELLKELQTQTKADTIYWNRRYEPQIITRDTEIKKYFTQESIDCQSFNSAMIFEPWEVENNSKKPFRVFTPFYKKCLSQEEFVNPPQEAPKKLIAYEQKLESLNLDDLKLLPEIAWDKPIVEVWQPGFKAAQNLLDEFLDDGDNLVTHYDENRNTPGISGTSKISPYLHFGEISSRRILFESRKLIGELRSKKSASSTKSIANTESYVREIYWREFAYQLLYNFPKVAKEPLNDKYKKFPFLKDKKSLHAWEHGMTGYPIVDAGMRELWYTGWMHNRVRMIVSSFLVKHQLISWKEGEKWFWDTLVDADLASNNMGWQWVAGCGADAAPYFRIFNPITQGEKFDTDGSYVRKWVPEIKHLPNKWIFKPFEAPEDVLKKAKIEFYDSLSNNKIAKSKNLKSLDWDKLINNDDGINYYPQPVVEHKFARERALAALEKVK